MSLSHNTSHCGICGLHSRAVDQESGTLECGAVLLGSCFPTFRQNAVPLPSYVERSKTQRRQITCQTTWLLLKAPQFVQQRETRLGEQQPQDELTFSARLLCAEPLIPCTVGSDEREP